MELFHNAKTVRLRSHYDKYLFADEDEESVTQDRSGSSKNAHWTVEFVHDDPCSPEPVRVRLRSCYKKYLTGSHQAFLLGMTGHRVLQALPNSPEGSREWEPVREQPGMTGPVRLRGRDGRFLRANGGLPPWRNSVTSDVPFTTWHQSLVVWDVHVVAFLDHVPSCPQVSLPGRHNPANSSVVGKDNKNVSYEEAVAILSKILANKQGGLRGVAAAKIKQLTAELGMEASREFDVVERIESGFAQFKITNFDKNPNLFRELAHEQHPKFLVFACSDSRVSPTHMLNFQPGEAFTVRNIANIVPPYDKVCYTEVGACIEYAVTHLKVENILIIGHSRCGGIKGLMNIPNDTVSSDLVENWVQICSAAKMKVKSEFGHLSPEQQCYHCEKEAVNVSLGNLLTYPFVSNAVMQNTLMLRGARYDFIDGHLQLWDLDFGIISSL